MNKKDNEKETADYGIESSKEFSFSLNQRQLEETAGCWIENPQEVFNG